MDNKYFLDNLKNTYESLRFFNVEDGFLVLNYNGTFKFKLEHIILSNLNPNLFLITPTEIFQVIYVLELLFKNALTDSEIKFIESYTNKYLHLSTDALNNNEFDANRLWCLSIPIYTAYDDMFTQTPGSQIIQNGLNKQTADINSGKSLQPKLVLIKDDLPNLEDDDAMKNFAQAGFTTLILVATTITLTVLYIIYFVSQG